MTEVIISTPILGIILTLVIFLIAFQVDNEEKKNIWKPILFALDVPLSLSCGIYYLGNSLFSIGFWVGIFMFSFAIVLSLAVSYYGLLFGRRG